MKNCIILSLLLALFSCTKEENVQKIDSTVLVSTQRVNSLILLNAQTENFFGTQGYQILFSKRNEKSEIVISFNGISAPEYGQASPGNAKCNINLGDLENGEYDIIFNLNDQKTTGKLLVGSSADLSLDSGGNVELQ